MNEKKINQSHQFQQQKAVNKCTSQSTHKKKNGILQIKWIEKKSFTSSAYFWLTLIDL